MDRNQSGVNADVGATMSVGDTGSLARPRFKIPDGYKFIGEGAAGMAPPPSARQVSETAEAPVINDFPFVAGAAPDDTLATTGGYATAAPASEQAGAVLAQPCQGVLGCNSEHEHEQKGDKQTDRTDGQTDRQTDR
jgi:hypothetical protein